MDHESLKRVAAALTDIQQVLQDPEGHVEDQHLVSKVLLKRFAAHSGPDARRIVPFSLDHPDSKQRAKSPTACGKVPGFIKFGSGHLERHVWKSTEDKLTDALQAVDDRTLFDHPEHAATIRDAMALHYVRSTQIRHLQRGMWPEVMDGQRRWWLGPGATLLDHGYYSKHGLYPGSIEERRRFIEELMEPFVEAAESGLLHDSRMEALFGQARALVANSGLEILTPATGQFLIGDVPAFTIRHDRIAAGVRNGIPIGDAHSLVLPLGPRRLAALGPVNNYGTIPEALRDRLNTVQVQEADHYVYFRPGSGLERFVRAHPRIQVAQQVASGVQKALA